MDKQARRQIAKDFRERKPAPGIYAVRCAATGETWVAASRNIEAQQNSLWFGLRAGGHPNKGLQAVWNAHGQDALAFEVLERIDPGDLTPLGLSDLVKTRERHWLAALDAKRAVG